MTKSVTFYEHGDAPPEHNRTLYKAIRKKEEREATRTTQN